MNQLPSNPFTFACPVCGGGLTWVAEDALRCAVDGLTFGREGRIWRFLPPEREAALAQFRQEYETVRRSEGRGSDASAFYRALPFTERPPRFLKPRRSASEWAVRAQSFGVLLEQVVKPLEEVAKRPLHILDMGAGNGWLSNRLAAQGHVVGAVDLGVNVWDGLGAHRHYETAFVCLQAEFDHLPLAEGQFDLLIFNASFHYSVKYEATLREAGRVLRADGQVAVVDTAVYQQQTSGQQMVAEREAHFQQQHGFASNALPSENFLTPDRLNQLAQNLHWQWQRIETVPSWRQWIRQLKVTARRQREPARFPLIVFRTAKGSKV